MKTLKLLLSVFALLLVSQFPAMCQSPSSQPVHLLTLAPHSQKTSRKLTFTSHSRKASRKLRFIPRSIAHGAALKAEIASPATSTSFGGALAPTTGETFVLHKQMSNREYGLDPYSVTGSVAGYVKFLTEARAAGADAISLDYGDDDSASGYPQSLVNIYVAANQLNAANGWGSGQTGQVNALGVGKISLYLTFDFSNPALENTQTVLSILQRTLPDPANLTQQGKPVWSCYAGGGGRSWASLAAIFQPVLASLKQQNITPYGIWGGEATNSDGSQCDGSVDSLTAWMNGCIKPIADSVWSYSSGNSPLGLSSGIPYQESLARAAKASGIGFQGSLNPGYAFARSWVDFRGGEGINAEWRSLLDTDAPLLGSQFLGVQFVTADDIGEMSNLLLGYDPAFREPAQGADYYLATDGRIADNSYYLYQLKTGVKPVIASDTLCVSYQVLTGAAMAAPTNDPAGPISGYLDENGYFPAVQAHALAYVTCYLASSATVRLTSAEVPAATHTHLSTPENDQVIFDPVTPFTGQEVGETLQFTYGSGFTPGNYTVTAYAYGYSSPNYGPQVYLQLDRSPGRNGLTNGQGTVYAAGATLPDLPPPPLITTVFASTGQSFLRLPNQAGNTQTIELLRNNQAVLTLTGHGISSTSQIANPHYWTGTTKN